MDEKFRTKRSYERKHYRADILFSHDEKAYRGTLKNLSVGGAFVRCPNVNQFSRGDLITVSIPYTTGERHVKRRGKIKWKNDEGFAIEFM